MILLFKKEKVNKIQFSLNGETDHLKGCHSFTILYSAVICWNFSRRHNDLKPGFVSESPGRLLFVSFIWLFVQAPQGTQAASQALAQHRISGTPPPLPQCSEDDILHVCNDSNYIVETCQRRKSSFINLFFAWKNTMENVNHRPTQVILLFLITLILSFNMLK